MKLKINLGDSESMKQAFRLLVESEKRKRENLIKEMLEAGEEWDVEQERKGEK